MADERGSRLSRPADLSGVAQDVKHFISEVPWPQVKTAPGVVTEIYKFGGREFVGIKHTVVHPLIGKPLAEAVCLDITILFCLIVSLGTGIHHEWKKLSRVQGQTECELQCSM